MRTTALSFLILSGFLKAASASAQICSPLAHYPLNGDATDATMNGMDGTVLGAVPTTDRSGMPGQAMYFDGVDDRIDLPSDFDVPQRTWALWCKADVIDASVHEVYDNDHNGIENAQTELFFREENGVKKIILNMGSTNTLYSQEVEEGVWYHVAQVRSDTEVRFYIDGCLVFTSTDLSNAHSDQGLPTVALGTGRMHNNYHFQGSLDDVLVYPCALDDARIDSLAGHRCAPICTPLVWYKLDGDAVDTMNGFDGVVFDAVPAADRFGVDGGAMYLDGINARIDLPSDFDVPQRTWALWCKADVIDASVHEVYDNDHGGMENAQTELFFREEGGVKKIILNMGSTNTLYSQEVEEGVWYHVAQVRSDTEVRFYINGCLVFTSTDLSNVHSDQGLPTVALGTGRMHNNYHFQGSLDDVRVYTCALSDAEVDLLADRQCVMASVVAHAPATFDLLTLGDGRFSLAPFTDARSYVCRVFDAVGRPVSMGRYQGRAIVDLSQQAAGSYILRVEQAGEVLVRRVMVLH